MAIGVPLLLLFGGLFVAADAVFKSLLVSAFPDWRQAWTHLAQALGFAWYSAGLLRDLLATREEEHQRWLRVVIEADGETVHNTFFDRNFKP